MYLAEKLMNKTSGLSFYKLLGTGAGAGFSLYPDFSTYSILCVWKDRLSADNFINKSHHSILISKTRLLYRINQKKLPLSLGLL